VTGRDRQDRVAGTPVIRGRKDASREAGTVPHLRPSRMSDMENIVHDKNNAGHGSSFFFPGIFFRPSVVFRQIVASSFDALSVYHAYLIALGLYTVSRRISYRRVTALVVLLWVVYVSLIATIKGLVW